MIIGKDRTNMPVTSTGEFDNKLDELDENIDNKTTLYKHLISFVDDHDSEYDVVVISGNNEKYLKGDETHSVYTFLQKVRSDAKVVSMYIIDQQDTGVLPLYQVIYVGEEQSAEYRFYTLIGGAVNYFQLNDQDQHVGLEDSVTQL